MHDARTARGEALQRFRAYAQVKLGEFLANVDPISGQRLVELVAEGSKTSGALAVGVSFFEGTRFHIGVDLSGNLAVEASPADVLRDIGRALDVIVPVDLSKAELIYEPVAGPRGARRSLDLGELIARLVDSAAAAVEKENGDVPQVPDAPRLAAVPSVAPVAPVAKPLNFSVG